MADNILAEVEVHDPGSCYVTPHASEEWSVTDVSRCRLEGDAETVVEEFTLAGSSTADPPEPADDEPVERVFSYDDEHVYRVTRPAEQECACACIEQAGCVVRDIVADEASLVVTFLVDGTETLQDVIADLREIGDRISLHRLVDSSTDRGGGSPTVLNRGRLTDRQQEVLATAYEMGYFEHPRDATAGEVAERLGIATTTFTEHLAAAQRKLLSEMLAE